MIEERDFHMKTAYSDYVSIHLKTLHGHVLVHAFKMGDSEISELKRRSLI